MTTTNESNNYSRHGSQLFQDKFRIYHQGGLDCYCGFYAIFNLINSLHFKKTGKADFVGEQGFEEFRPIRDLPSFKRSFSKVPFGLSTETRALIDVLSPALEKARLKGTARIEEDLSIPVEGKANSDRWLRIGIEKAFTSPSDVLGLAAVMEDEHDDLQHWVVFVGEKHLGRRDIDSKNFDGVVLDSDRGYTWWKINNVEREKPYIEIARSDEIAQRMHWISSFISVSVD